MWARRAMEILLLAGLALVLGYFAERPRYAYTAPNVAVVQVNFVHAAERLIPCKRPTREELRSQPANRLQQLVCPRGRAPVRLKVDIDGVTRIERRIEPAGFYDDGPAIAHMKFEVPLGRHEVTLQLGDSRDGEGYDYRSDLTVDMTARQNLAIDFDADRGFFVR